MSDSNTPNGKIKVKFINNDGGGFADVIEIPAGMTVKEFFVSRMAGADPANYLIRVNRNECEADQVIANGDRVSLTPTKVEGAM